MSYIHMESSADSILNYINIYTMISSKTESWKEYKDRVLKNQMLSFWGKLIGLALTQNTQAREPSFKYILWRQTFSVSEYKNCY
jgi:hypothetical protein